MKKTPIGIYGANRGGNEIVKALPTQILDYYDGSWQVADPKEGRAETLATRIHDRFSGVRTQVFPESAQTAIIQAPDNATLVLAMDTVESIKDTLALRRPEQASAFQIVGRGPGGAAGTHIGIRGMLLPGDDESARRSDVLMAGLDEIARAASSRVLTNDDPLTAAALQPMRREISRRTVQTLMERERDPYDLSFGPLNIMLADRSYPLVPVETAPLDRYRQRQELALETASYEPLVHWAETGLGYRQAVVAMVVRSQRTVFFFMIVQNRQGQVRVKGVTEFSPPPKQQEIAAPAVAPALFTD